MQQSERLSQPQLSRSPWLEVGLPAQSSPVYIEEIIISPVSVSLTFTSGSEALSANGLVLLQMLLRAVGTSVVNLDDAHIVLKGFRLQNCFDTPEFIAQKLLIRYK